MRFAFIDAEKAHHSVRTLCRVLRLLRLPTAWTEPAKAQG